ncbi:hypothetical protein E3T46_17605 [Cryobacterium sp. Hh11]|uniref:hypothetical protein n=1 Tax=Cryobacterium sp. Hh11 TaxID=2555868 RepID=UPI00106CFBB3|nr:hypothetical protein [Cryobacterium sp. Hh11]TFD47608.1 hypothetical protein E3T46_17605 [Cryobacterium sp. Hh11]
MSSYRKVPNPHWMDDDLSRLDLFDGRRPSSPYPPEPTHGSQIIESDRRRRVNGRARRRLIMEWLLVAAILALLAAGVRLIAIWS